MDLNNLAFVDVETTGLDILQDRVIELGIVKVIDGKVTKKYSTLVNPEVELLPEIEKITGIKSAELKTAPKFSEVNEEVRELLKNATFIAHNARFDYGFISNEFKRIGIEFSATQICTLKLSRHFYPQFYYHSLDSIINRFSFTFENRHRALDDAYVLWQFYNHMKNNNTEEFFKKSLELFVQMDK